MLQELISKSGRPGFGFRSRTELLLCQLISLPLESLICPASVTAYLNPSMQIYNAFDLLEDLLRLDTRCVPINEVYYSARLVPGYLQSAPESVRPLVFLPTRCAERIGYCYHGVCFQLTLSTYVKVRMKLKWGGSVISLR